MSELFVALGIWLPLGTIVPLVLSRLTGADWRGALIEASLFATIGVLILPILFALTIAPLLREPNVDLIFAVSYVLALICVLLFRRHSNRSSNERRYGQRSS
jgi:ABC-type enterochelin transport system permease subunit